MGKTYLTVQQRHVLDVRMLNIVQHSRVLSNASHADSVRVVTPQVLDQDVGRVGLGREAVVSNVDPRVQNRQAVHVVGVESIRVLGLGL
jgi:hypothetical protein